MVSIIVPVYNCETILKKCVDSILAQTYEDIEVILVDDGSKDQSGAICDEYMAQDARIKVIHKENGGVSTARNAGLRIAKGTYVQFVDSDDYLENSITESMVQVMEEEGSDLVVCGYQRHEKNKVVDMIPNTVKKCRISEMDLKVEKLFKNYYLNAPWNKLYKRENITAGFREDYALAEDLLFNLQYIKGIKYVSFLEGVFYHYIVGDNDSLSKKRDEKFFDIRKLTFIQTWDFCEENLEHRKWKEELSSDYIVSMLYAFKSIYENQIYDEKKKKELIRKYIKDETIKRAGNYARFETKQRKMACWLMQRGYWHLLWLTFKLKK